MTETININGQAWSLEQIQEFLAHMYYTDGGDGLSVTEAGLQAYAAMPGNLQTVDIFADNENLGAEYQDVSALIRDTRSTLEDMGFSVTQNPEEIEAQFNLAATAQSAFAGIEEMITGNTRDNVADVSPTTLTFSEDRLEEVAAGIVDEQPSR